MEEGVRVPMQGRLYYRGMDVLDIVEHHAEQGSFGYEEVSYLLLMGKLPATAKKIAGALGGFAVGGRGAGAAALG